MARVNTNYRSQRTRALAAGASPCPNCAQGWLVYDITTDRNHCAKCPYTAPLKEEQQQETNPPAELFTYPRDWLKGQLLNVRKVGESYFRVTLLGEEFDPEHPERCLQFSDSFETQAFVSWWYSREATDPRA